MACGRGSSWLSLLLTGLLIEGICCELSISHFACNDTWNPTVDCAAKISVSTLCQLQLRLAVLGTDSSTSSTSANGSATTGVPRSSSSSTSTGRPTTVGQVTSKNVIVELLVTTGVETLRVSSAYNVDYWISGTTNFQFIGKESYDVPLAAVSLQMPNICGQTYFIARVRRDGSTDFVDQSIPIQLRCPEKEDLNVKTVFTELLRYGEKSMFSLKTYPNQRNSGRVFVGAVDLQLDGETRDTYDMYSQRPMIHSTEQPLGFFIPGFSLRVKNMHNETFTSRTGPSVYTVSAYVKPQLWYMYQWNVGNQSSQTAAHEDKSLLDYQLGDVMLHEGNDLVIGPNAKSTLRISPKYSMVLFIEKMVLRSRSVCGNAVLVVQLKVNNLPPDSNAKNNYFILPVFIDCWGHNPVQTSETCQVIPNYYDGGQTSWITYSVPGQTKVYEYKSEERSVRPLNADFDLPILQDVALMKRTTEMQSHRLIQMEQCVNTVWGASDYFVTSLDVLVSSLRKYWEEIRPSGQVQKLEHTKIGTIINVFSDLLTLALQPRNPLHNWLHIPFQCIYNPVLPVRRFDSDSRSYNVHTNQINRKKREADVVDAPIDDYQDFEAAAVEGGQASSITLPVTTARPSSNSHAHSTASTGSQSSTNNGATTRASGSSSTVSNGATTRSAGSSSTSKSGVTTGSSSTGALNGATTRSTGSSSTVKNGATTRPTGSSSTSKSGSTTGSSSVTSKTSQTITKTTTGAAASSTKSPPLTSGRSAATTAGPSSTKAPLSSSGGSSSTKTTQRGPTTSPHSTTAANKATTGHGGSSSTSGRSGRIVQSSTAAPGTPVTAQRGSTASPSTRPPAPTRLYPHEGTSSSSRQTGSSSARQFASSSAVPTRSSTTAAKPTSEFHSGSTAGRNGAASTQGWSTPSWNQRSTGSYSGSSRYPYSSPPSFESATPEDVQFGPKSPLHRTLMEEIYNIARYSGEAKFALSAQRWQALSVLVKILLYGTNTDYQKYSYIPTNTMEGLVQVMKMVVSQNLPRTFDNIPESIRSVISNWVQKRWGSSVSACDYQDVLQLSLNVTEELKFDKTYQNRLDQLNLLSFVFRVLLADDHTEYIAELHNRIIAASQLDRTWMIRDGVPIHEPTQDDICSRYAAVKLWQLQSLPMFQFAGRTVSPDQYQNVFWTEEQGTIFRGDRSDLTGQVFWTKVATCSCPAGSVCGAVGENNHPGDAYSGYPQSQNSTQVPMNGSTRRPQMSAAALNEVAENDVNEIRNVDTETMALYEDNSAGNRRDGDIEIETAEDLLFSE